MQLRAFLAARLPRRRTKQVVFFDEVPWLASRRSGFLAAFEHFWNGWAVKQPKLVVVICGSAASWMLQKIVRQRGGLHNRVTRRITTYGIRVNDHAQRLGVRSLAMAALFG